jgi:uncharacterized protein YggE
MSRARELAQKAGYTNVRVLRVEESDYGRSYVSGPMVMRTMDASEKSTPISPGELNIGANMSFTFEMVK